MKLNQALQGLLAMAYELIYEDKDSNVPTFTIPVAPNLPYELLLPLFDAQVFSFFCWLIGCRSLSYRYWTITRTTGSLRHLSALHWARMR